VKASASLRTANQPLVWNNAGCQTATGPPPPSPHYLYPLTCVFRYLSGNWQFDSDARQSMHSFKTYSIVTTPSNPRTTCFGPSAPTRLSERGTHMHVLLDPSTNPLSWGQSLWLDFAKTRSVLRRLVDSVGGSRSGLWGLGRARSMHSTVSSQAKS
jgi:hypothetical protein